MFRKKKKNKDLDFKIHIIEKLGTLEAQNSFLLERVKKLEQRITDLEISKRIGF
jgi:hypothetical protein